MRATDNYKQHIVFEYFLLIFACVLGFRLVLLSIGILIGTQVSDFVHKNKEKKPIPISEIEGIYIPPEEFVGVIEWEPVG